MSVAPNIDWDAVIADRRFQTLHRKKQGFLMPWEVWMKNELRPFAENLIQRIGHRDFIQQQALQSKWNSFLEGNPKER